MPGSHPALLAANPNRKLPCNPNKKPQDGPGQLGYYVLEIMTPGVVQCRGANMIPAFKLLSVDELKSLPPPTWLLQELLVAGSLAILYGPPGVGKSFLALDFALSIATNHAGIAEPKVSGPVVYVSAEGSGGLMKRVDAWGRAHGCKAANIHFLTESVNFLAPASVDALNVALRKLPESPCLIVIDTLARCMSGGDENSAQDAGQFIAMIDRVRSTFKCTVLVVHHAGKGRKNEERGSSALRGAADTMLCLSGTISNLRLTCEKQKDAAPFQPISLRLETIELGDGEASCVIRPGSDGSRIHPSNDHQKAILQILSGAGELTHTELKDKFIEGSKCSKSTFDRTLAELTGRNLIKKTDSGKYSLIEEVSSTKPVSLKCHDTG